MTYAVWEVVNFVLNGLIFIFIGLQLRDVMLGIREYQPGKLLLYGVSISLVVILARFIWIIPALLFPHRFGKKSRTREKMDPKELVIFGWSGMRGVVSMAAALAIPIELANGAPFPHRSLLIFLTFCVILSTLVVLGLTLPWMIKILKIKPHSIVAEEYLIRTEVVKAVIDHIEANLSLVPEELLRNIKSKYEVKFNRLQKNGTSGNLLW
jgi:CPA1 family monovalent cation:H+ antiporter